MYEKTSKSWIKHWDFMLLDFLCIHISLLIAYTLRFPNGFCKYLQMYQTMAIVLSLVFIAVVMLYSGYKNILRRGYYKEFTMLLKQTFIIAMLSVFVLYIMQKSRDSSRLVFIMTFAIDVILSYFIRILHKRNLLKKSKNNLGRRSLIIICLKRNAKQFLSKIKDSVIDVNITGVIIADKDMTGKMILDIPVVAGYDDAVNYLCRNWVDEIFIGKATNDLIPDFTNELKQACQKMGITIHTMLLSLDTDPTSIITEKFGGYLVLSQSVAIVTQRDMMLKRLMDIAGGIVGCFLTAILFVIFAPLIYIASPGPIFFSQQRVGKNGKLFKIYKFRSMYMDAEERKKELMEQNKVKDGMMFKMDKDPRIIKGIGHVIRDLSIDEFPQFWNVLKGDMSLVGTRPPTLDEWEKYELHHRKRLAIKPGLTGMWQVSGRSNITDFEEIVKLDTQYIEEWSISLDIIIILKTILVVLKKEGSQ